MGGGCKGTLESKGGHSTIMQLLPFVCCNEQFIVDRLEENPDFILEPCDIDDFCVSELGIMRLIHFAGTQGPIPLGNE